MDQYVAVDGKMCIRDRYQNLNRVDEICSINGLEDVNHLEAGTRLILP